MSSQYILMSTGLRTLPRPFPGLGSTMDPQAYHNPTYTHVSNNTYTYTNSTLISTYTYINNNPYSATPHNNHLPFTFYLFTFYLLPFTYPHKQYKQLISIIALNCNHISYHSLSSIETPGVRPLRRV